MRITSAGSTMEKYARQKSTHAHDVVEICLHRAHHQYCRRDGVNVLCRRKVRQDPLAQSRIDQALVHLLCHGGSQLAKVEDVDGPGRLDLERLLAFVCDKMGPDRSSSAWALM